MCMIKMYKNIHVLLISVHVGSPRSNYLTSLHSCRVFRCPPLCPVSALRNLKILVPGISMRENLAIRTVYDLL